VRQDRDNILWVSDWKISSDMKLLLLKTDRLKQWRHSSFGNYWIHDIEAKKTWPMAPPTQPPTIAYAVWSPTGQSIAYVADNDIYVIPSAASASQSPIRITSNGNTSLFNGVPDWVYEEEVFASDFALWWSPDSTKLAFLHLDETLVEEYTYPVYNPTEDSNAVIPYPDHVTMKYPKPGYHNPIVSAHVFELDRYRDAVAVGDDEVENHKIELDWTGKLPDESRIVFEVVWVGNAELIVKEVDRAGEDGRVVYFDLAADSLGARVNGRVVRKLGKNGEEGDDGWIESVSFRPRSVGSMCIF
jgi:dipeptidyl aminopeptidase